MDKTLVHNGLGIVGLMILPGRGLKAPLSDLLNQRDDRFDRFKKKLPLTLKN